MCQIGYFLSCLELGPGRCNRRKVEYPTRIYAILVFMSPVFEVKERYPAYMFFSDQIKLQLTLKCLKLYQASTQEHKLFSLRAYSAHLHFVALTSTITAVYRNATVWNCLKCPSFIVSSSDNEPLRSANKAKPMRQNWSYPENKFLNALTIFRALSMSMP